MKEWEPIVKQTVLEPFVEDEKQSQTIVGNVFIGMGLMVMAAFLALLFYWSYEKNRSLFIALFSGLVFLFSVKMVILVAVVRKKLNNIIFKLYMGSTVFMSFVSMFSLIYFSIRASRSSSSSSSSSYSSSYNNSTSYSDGMANE